MQEYVLKITVSSFTEASELFYLSLLVYCMTQHIKYSFIGSFLLVYVDTAILDYASNLLGLAVKYHTRSISEAAMNCKLII